MTKYINSYNFFCGFTSCILEISTKTSTNPMIKKIKLHY